MFVNGNATARVVVTDTGANIAGTLSVSGNISAGNVSATTFTGALTGAATTAGTVTTAAQSNITSLGTLTNISTSGNVNASQTINSASMVATGNITGANLIATSYHVRSVGTGITAAGTTQGGATALSKEINIVSTVSGGANGVLLPTAVAGMVIIINNTSATTLNVYPATGAAINTGAANAAYSHIASASLQYYAPTTTQWYTVGATYT